VTVTNFKTFLRQGKLRCLPGNLLSSIRELVTKHLKFMPWKIQFINLKGCRAPFMKTRNLLIKFIS